MKKYQLFILENEKNSQEASIFEEEIIGSSISEIKLKAENLLESNFSGNTSIFNEDVKIKLISKVNPSEIYEMIWNEKSFVKSNGYFKGWKYIHNDNQTERTSSKFRNSSLIPIIFSITILVSALSIFMIDNIEGVFSEKKEKEYIIKLTFAIFTQGFLYSGISPLARSNFNDKVSTVKGIIGFNILLEIPVWIAATSTFYNLNISGLFEIIELWRAVLVILIYAFAKVLFSSLLDINKLSSKKENII